ncbi:MAG: class I SAM-dependent RNA methyltransferase [Acidimicrobiales bacterium]
MELEPSTMASGGDAVARDSDGKAVFVRGALPGERVAVEILTDHAQYAIARVVRVLEPSPLRATPPCPEVTHGCGACQWQHITPAGQRVFKERFVTEAIGRAGVYCPEPRPTVELEPWVFRTTISAAVARGRAGYFKGRTHDVVAVEGCLVAHPLLVDLLVDGRYPEARRVLLRCGVGTGERLAVTTPSRLPAVVPADVRHDHVHEQVGGRSWRISARSFFQTRPDGARALATLVGEAADGTGPSSTAVDLYSGVGLFAGLLADRGWAVTAVEGAQSAVDDARENLAGSDARVVRSNVTTWTPEAADLVVADPSRAGLGRPGADTVAATGARRVVLVSCDAVSTGRDAALLQAAGYSLTSVQLVDMFPHTFRVEALSVYDR